MKVILTEAFGEVGRLVRRSLEDAGAEVFLFQPTLKVKDARNYVNELAAFQSLVKADMIIPIFFPEVISRYRDEFPEVEIPVDFEEKLQVLDNKLEACALASSLGIRMPRMYGSIDEVERYPVVFKRVGGHGGDSVYFPKKRESLAHLVGASLPGTYLITDEIPGDDVSVDAVRWDGFFFAAAYRVLLPRAKGVSILRESISSPELTETARRILDKVDYRGVCGLDFRVDSEGRSWFLECNPRFSGGIASQIASGFDVPAVLMSLVRGERPVVDFRPGVITRDNAAIREYLKRRLRQKKLDVRDVVLALFKRGRLRFLP